ncbi:hypothetical protein AVEN_115929-1 [Araneus ventricosus]|uniref:Uncharacterized protein n=1 Tax=Araneus ventricosus TaxID=182803 RepID=A0A4Y2JLT8_ARAVE|nr:hypothetical protein AVEN_115929-1 [Araneus ventricosus]
MNLGAKVFRDHPGGTIVFEINRASLRTRVAPKASNHESFEKNLASLRTTVFRLAPKPRLTKASNHILRVSEREFLETAPKASNHEPYESEDKS